MNLTEFLRLIDQNLPKMVIAALVAGALVFHATRDTPKEYESTTMINTGLVSGYNIENSGGGRIDYGFTNNEMENIMNVIRGQATMQELAARLLAQALMLKKPTHDTLWADGFAKLQTEVPADVREQVVDYQSHEATYANLVAWRSRLDKNPIRDILTGGHPLFGVESLQKMTIRKEGTNSDNIRITWTTQDPAVCRNALVEITRIAIKNYRAIKEGQAANVLEFFERSTREAAGALSGKEDELLGFMVSNKIINYYEQTRFIASKKEDLDEYYYKELMKLAAADSTRRGLEAKLGRRVELPLINQKLLARRGELIDVSSKLASLEIRDKLDSVQISAVDERHLTALRQRSEALKSDLRAAAESTFAVNRTPDGIEIKSLLDQWLNQWIEVEQTLAHLNVLAARKRDFDIVYGRFAPWGSRIKRLEREIDVCERAYLENLHSYNQARLHQYNLALSANLRTVDAAAFPEDALPSKRASSIILAAVGALVVVLVFALSRELLDQTLRDPTRAAHQTGLKLAGAFPRMADTRRVARNIDFPVLLQRANDNLARQVRLDLRELDIVRPSPARVAVVSARAGEGKSIVARWLSERLPNSEAVCVEIPPLLTGNYTFDDLKGTDYAIFVARADRTWNAADKRAAEIVSKITGKPCELVLNFVQPERLESIIGEIPKKRSFFRKWLKKMSTFNFK